jgi:hypothetical protein
MTWSVSDAVINQVAKGTAVAHFAGRSTSKSVASRQRVLLRSLPHAYFGGYMKHYLLTVAILVAALALYGIGMASGALLLFAVGAGCELWFWVRVLGRRKNHGPLSTRTRNAPFAV